MKSILVKDSQGKRSIELESVLLSERDIYLCGEITVETAMNLNMQLLALRRECKDEKIRIWLTSHGGDVRAALAIMDIIKTCGMPVYVIGYASVYSAGALVLAAAQPNRRYCLPNTEIMLHQVSTQVGGNCDSVTRYAEKLKKSDATIKSILSEATGKTSEEIEKACAYDNFMIANEALEFGIVDKIVSIEDIIV